MKMKAMKIVCLFLSLSGVHTGFLLAQGLSEKTGYYLQMAMNYYKSGKYEKAGETLDVYCDLTNCDKVQDLRQNIETCRELNKSARDAKNEGKYTMAIAFYERILSVNPDDPKARKHIDEVRKFMGKLDPDQESEEVLLEEKFPSLPTQKDSDGFFQERTLGINMKMIYVEGGSFWMGCTSEQGSDCGEDEYPLHRVNLASYYISECEITQEQWWNVMKNSYYQQQRRQGAEFSVNKLKSNYPVTDVSWEDAQAFCKELSAKTGRKYRLPTEAEWEYAARGGKNSKGRKYSGSSLVENVAWSTENSDEYVHPVGRKVPNELGLYDMSGNVWEWCADSYREYRRDAYSSNAESYIGENRVLRGGSWDDAVRYCRVSARYYDHQENRDSYTGFRVVCEP